MADPSLIIAGLALAGTCLASYATYRGSKNATRVGLESNAFQRAVAAEQKTEAAEARVDALTQRLRKVERNMVSLESRMQYVVQLIHDPYITLEFLRERVPMNFNSRRRDERE